MTSVLAVVAVACATFACILAGINPDTLLHDRPDLGIYQDISKCTSQGTTWYVMYRNAEKGKFGPGDRCLRDTQISEVANDKARFRFRYGTGQERNATFAFMSSQGQTGKNIIKIQLDGDPKAALHDLLFVDCRYCRIIKSQRDPKCTLSVTERSLRHGLPQHCAFLYDLFCGTEHTYQVSDASCLGDDKKQG